MMNATRVHLISVFVFFACALAGGVLLTASALAEVNEASQSKQIQINGLSYQCDQEEEDNDLDPNLCTEVGAIDYPDLIDFSIKSDNHEIESYFQALPTAFQAQTAEAVFCCYVKITDPEELE